MVKYLLLGHKSAQLSFKINKYKDELWIFPPLLKRVFDAIVDVSN